MRLGLHIFHFLFTGNQTVNPIFAYPLRMNKFRLLILFLFLSGALRLAAQQPDAEGSLVKWMSLEEALAKNDTLPRPILLDFYTSWCGWCKHMMKTTYADPGLSQYINTYFYPAKFNAEGKDTLDYLGKKYGPTSAAPRAPHAFTVKMLKDQLMYPTTLFLNGYDKSKKEFGVSMIASGYLDRQKIEPLLVYNVENVFRSASYDDFSAQFQKAFYDSTLDKQLEKIKWLMPKEVFSTPEPKKKKKTLVFIHTDWCNACKVMQRATFSDSSVSAYLAGKFNLVDLDAQTKDTIQFKGQAFVNAQLPQAPFHQLALALSRNNLVLPTVALLDEDLNLLDAVSYYIHPKFLDDILHFYGDDVYRNKPWKDYMTEKQKAAQESTAPELKK